ncbi:20084_t:CDS:2 [Dentiscutata erythropus]|uniref:20084_t:CDS:1 n=1 Tax=Dentiscutata erythropus TaxID=1348616 RepID=A0A9N9ILG5_9GLOM|nr:20084_t:CDS:2 [Dentiscutata erythropus]
MSKLRAEITWNHHRKSDFTELPPTFHEVNVQDLTKLEEPGESKNTSDDFASIEELDKEEIKMMDTEDKDEKILSVHDVVHPAVDSNAKWDLITLFNEIELP